MVGVFLSFGYLMEKLFQRHFTTHYFRYATQTENKESTIRDDGQLTTMEKLSSALVRIIPEIIGLLIFAGCSFIVYMIFIWTTSPFLKLFFLASLVTLVLIRALLIVARIIFSPGMPQFRALALECSTAASLSKLFTWLGSYMIGAIMFSIVAYKLGAQLSTLQLLQLFFATVVLLVSAIAVMVFKKRIKALLIESAEQEPSWGRKKFADTWHFLALLYIFLLWLLVINVFDVASESRTRGAFFLSFFILPIGLVMDRIIQWIVGLSLKTLKIYDSDIPENLSEDELEHNEKGRTLLNWSKITARYILVITLIAWLASLWGFSLPFLSPLASVLFDAVIIVAVALLFWQFVSNWIERKIAEAIPDEEEEKDDDEWGGAANRGRSYTLLPMIRKFIGSVLVVMVTMTVLSSMGVNIGPLLAGAGVVGLALGFGAQKLVADMFSGFFYLLDDAFRVGEYLEAGNVSGTVENITLRNVMLRHHRGMLQIVPHSQLGAITNFMRGGIVVKFNLDFPYDADIDKIRKVIKKVGQAMLEDEELGKDFIKPVKSQGVREIANSVMTIRVKFTAQPGAHFLIRREAYKRITEALHAKNIYYAHRKVIVDLPQSSTDPDTEQGELAAGAAAMDSLEEQEKQTATGDRKPYSAADG